MNLNATLIGQFVIVLAIVMVPTSYYLGKRKTQTPKITVLVGLLSALLPPLAIIFLMALVLKDDVDNQHQ